MRKFIKILKKKDGVALVSAIAFMTIAVALCSIITTFVVVMAKTASSYTTVNENKIIADQIAADFLKGYNDNSYKFNADSYEGYTIDTSTQYTCIAYEEGSTVPIITVVVEETLLNSSKYIYTRYEYGNI